MTVLADRPVQPFETSEAEALFREAKRRERKRRLFAMGSVLVLAGGIVAVVSAGGIGHGSRPTKQRPAPQPHPIALGAATWSAEGVFQADLATQPVALPDTSFAYAIEVHSDSPTSPTGRLVRINLLNGAVTVGPQVTNAQEMFVLGNSVAILTLPVAADASAHRLHSSPYVLETVIGHTAALGTAHNMRPLDDGNQVVLQSGPLVGGDEFWIAEGDTAYALNPRSGTIVRRLTLGGSVASIAVAPGGSRVYVALNELMAHPTTSNPAIVEELEATTGRVIKESALPEAELGWATLEAVNGGVWASYRGGMNGTAVLLRSSDLTSVTPSHSLVTPEASVPTAGETVGDGIAPTPLSGSMWLTSALGTSCVAPTSGRLIAGTAFTRDASAPTQSWAPFANVGDTLYATMNVPSTGATRILAVRPPAGCK